MKHKTGLNHRHSTSTRDLRVRRKAAALAVAACFSTAVWANPTNPVVVHGTASFAQAGNVLNVTNSHNAIINWGSFSIGVNELTRFIQPSALSAVLNRVTGQDPSAILGALQSNGRVFLLNPNGIVFGAGAQIDVAGLVASTLNLSNADFLAGRMNFTGGTGAGSLVNQGAINATGGPVYLVGSAVTNQGIITNPGGQIVLAAGNSVELVNPGTPNLRVEIQAGNNEARNLGSLVADAGRIGIYAGLIKQGGVINADSAVAEGGRIMLRSTKRTDIEAGSVTSARGSTGGQILVLSDMQQGVTDVQGTLDASSNSATAPGNGGFIDTSAAKVQIGSGSVIRTAGANGGANGTWLIDPFDFVISPTGDMSAATLVSALGANNVVISTAPYGGPPPTFSGSSPGNGDIFVNEAVSWSNGNSLTLTAQRNVIVNNPITNAGKGGININAGWDTTSNPASPTLSNPGYIQVNAPLSTWGHVNLTAKTDVFVNNTTITSGAPGSSELDSRVNFWAQTGNVVINNSIITARGRDSAIDYGGQATVDITATAGNISIINGSQLVARGGNHTSGSPTYGGEFGSIYLDSGNQIIVSGGSQILAYGGSGLTAGYASIIFDSTAAVSVADSSVRAFGGDNTASFADGYAEIKFDTLSGGVSVVSSLISARSANGGTRNLALIDFDGINGPIDISSSSLQAQAQSATVDITANGANAINLTNSTVNSMGIDGGEIYMSANGGINFGSSSLVSSAGGGGYIDLYTSGGNIILGSASASNEVDVYAAGSIIDGNSGLNLAAQWVYLTASSGSIGAGNPVETLAGQLYVDTYNNGAIEVIDAGSPVLRSIYGGNVSIGAAGNLIVDGSEGFASGNLLLAANGNIVIGGSSYGRTVYGITGTNIQAGGSLSVLAGFDTYSSTYSASYLGTQFSNTRISTGGNINVNRSFIRGGPDVTMNVGGSVFLDGVLSMPAAIQAYSPNTINLAFANANGTFSINGVPGVLFDPGTGTGFQICVNPSSCLPAVPGSNIFVTYKSAVIPPSALEVPVNILVVATNQSNVQQNQNNSSSSTKEDEKKNKEKKDAPACR